MSGKALQRYTTAEKRRMALLRRKGLTISVIAKRFGCSPSTVRTAIAEAQREDEGKCST